MVAALVVGAVGALALELAMSPDSPAADRARVDLARNQLNDWDGPSSLPSLLTEGRVLRVDAIGKIP
jgi:hypothetical protein